MEHFLLIFMSLDPSWLLALHDLHTKSGSLTAQLQGAESKMKEGQSPSSTDNESTSGDEDLSCSTKSDDEAGPVIEADTAAWCACLIPAFKESEFGKCSLHVL